MRAPRLLVASIGTLALAFFPSQALAGTVTQDGSAIVYNADPATGANEHVSLGVDGGGPFVTSEVGVTSSVARRPTPTASTAR